MPRQRKPVHERIPRYRSIKTENHYAVAGVMVWHRIDGFKHLALVSNQVYKHGAVVLFMQGGDREEGNLPYELNCILINPGLYKRLIRQDENEPETLVPRTKVNPAKIVKVEKLRPTLVDHWLTVEGHAALMVMRHSLPGWVILPAEASDRIPEVVVKLVQLHRRNKAKGVDPGKPANEEDIEAEIARLVSNADAIRPQFEKYSR